MWPPCGEKSIKGAPKNQNWRWPSQPLNTPFVRTLLGSPDAEILKVVEQVYRGELAVVPNVLPYRQQDGWMRDLYQKITMYMARTGLQSDTRAARPSSRGQRHPHSHSIKLACSPSAGPWWTEVAKQLKEDIPKGQLESRRHYHSRERDRMRWHWSPSPQCPSRCQSPSSRPPWSHPAEEQLSHSMKNLYLQTRPHESRSWAQWHDAPTLAEEKLKRNSLGLTWKGT